VGRAIRRRFACPSGNPLAVRLLSAGYNMPVQVSAGAYYVFCSGGFLSVLGVGRFAAARLAVVLLALSFRGAYGLFYVVLLPLCSSIDFLAGLG